MEDKTLGQVRVRTDYGITKADDIEERRKHVHSADLENWNFQNTDK